MELSFSNLFKAATIAVTLTLAGSPQGLAESLEPHDGPDAPVFAAWSPGQGQLISGGLASRLRVWHGKRSIKIDHLGLLGVLSLDGYTDQDKTLLLSSGFDGTVRLWDLNQKDLLEEKFNDVINSIGFDSSTRYFAAGGKTLNVWGLKIVNNEIKMHQILHDKGVDATITSLCWLKTRPGTGDRSIRLATGDEDGMLCVWGYALGSTELDIVQEIETLPAQNNSIIGITGLSLLSPSSDIVVASHSDQSLRTWDISKGKAKPNENAIPAASFFLSRDGKYLAWHQGSSIFAGQTIDPLNQVTSIPLSTTSEPVAITLHVDESGMDSGVALAGWLAFYGRNDNVVYLYDLESKTIVHRTDVVEDVSSILIRPDKKQLAVVTSSKIELYPIEQGISQLQAAAPTSGTSTGTLVEEVLMRAYVGAKSEHLVAVSKSGKLHVWRTENNDVIGPPLQLKKADDTPIDNIVTVDIQTTSNGILLAIATLDQMHLQNLDLSDDEHFQSKHLASYDIADCKKVDFWGNGIMMAVVNDDGIHMLEYHKEDRKLILIQSASLEGSISSMDEASVVQHNKQYYILGVSKNVNLKAFKLNKATHLGQFVRPIGAVDSLARSVRSKAKVFVGLDEPLDDQSGKENYDVIILELDKDHQALSRDSQEIVIESSVNSLELSRDQNTFVAGGASGKIARYSAIDYKLLTHEIADNSSGIVDFDFTSDDSQLLIGYTNGIHGHFRIDDGAQLIWDSAAKENEVRCVSSFLFSQPATELDSSFHERGTAVLTKKSRLRIRLLPSEPSRIARYPGPAYSVRWSSQGDYFLTSGIDESLDTKSRSSKKTPTNAVTTVWKAKAIPEVYVKLVEKKNVDEEEVVNTPTHASAVYDAVFHPRDHAIIYTVGADSMIRRWKIGSSLPPSVDSMKENELKHNSYCLTIHPTQDIVFSGSPKNTEAKSNSLQLWTPDIEAIGVPLVAHVDRIMAMEFSPASNGSLLASVDHSGMVVFWDVPDPISASSLPTIKHSVSGLPESVNAVGLTWFDYLDDEQTSRVRLAVCATDGNIYLYDLPE